MKWMCSGVIEQRINREGKPYFVLSYMGGRTFVRIGANISIPQGKTLHLEGVLEFTPKGLVPLVTGYRD